MRPSVRRRILACCCVVLFVSPFLPGSSVAAQSGEAKKLRDLKAAREKVQSKRAQTASEVDVLKASNDELSAALTALSTNVDAETARLKDAQAAQAQAESEAATAQKDLEQSQTELVGLVGSIRDEAVRAYISSGSADQLQILSTDDPNDAVARKTFLEMKVSQGQASAERYRAIQEDLAILRDTKTKAAARANAKKQEADQKLADLTAAQDRQEKMQAAVNDRIDRALSEADSLAAFDGALSTEISNSQQRLAAQIAAEQARSRRPVPTGGVARTFASAGGSGIADAGGIRVAASIAGNVSALLNAAHADGINLGGAGYRDPAGQIAVRRNNCGGSNYAVYEAPASSCRPPTARPGTSQHEQGLAIDFTQDGRVLNRGSSAFGWLQANASKYGLYNLPSEPWHWSTTGN